VCERVASRNTALHRGPVALWVWLMAHKDDLKTSRLQVIVLHVI